MSILPIGRLAVLVAKFQKVSDLNLNELYNVLREILFVFSKFDISGGDGIVVTNSGTSITISKAPSTPPSFSSSSSSATEDSGLIFTFLTMGC